MSGNYDAVSAAVEKRMGTLADGYYFMFEIGWFIDLLIPTLVRVRGGRLYLVGSKPSAQKDLKPCCIPAGGAAECKELALKSRSCTGVIFAVDTLEYLHRGGRIGGGAKFLGSALDIRPILEIRDGRVESVERVRTRKKSLARLVQLVEERIAGRTPVRLASLHANSPVDAQWLLDAGCDRLQPVEKIYTEVTPVIGTHAGPGTVGLAFMAGM